MNEEKGIESQISEKKASSKHARNVLLVLTGVALLVNYVETMVIPGVPTIQKDFATTATIASWITSAYLIVGSAVLVCVAILVVYVRRYLRRDTGGQW